MPYTLPAFRRWFSTLRGEDGQPFGGLQAFQGLMLVEHFDGTMELVIVIPAKNTKTTTMAALALFHGQEVKRPEVVIAASSRDQAEILFNQGAMLVEVNKLQGFSVKGGYRVIRVNNGRIRVMAHDANTSDGVIPTLAIVDELHRHKDDKLYQVFRKGLGPRKGRIITISTAGSDILSPLGALRTKAHALPSFKRTGAHNFAQSKDGSFVFHEWCLEDGDDLHNMRVVKRANPLRASWKTIKALQVDHDAVSMTPGTWARFYCGIWTQGDEPWLQAGVWDRMRVDIGGAAPGDECAMAVEWRGVTAAIVVAAPKADAVGVWAHIVTEETGLAEFEALVEEAYRNWTPWAVFYEPNRNFQRSAELLMEKGVPMADYLHSEERMSAASGTLRRLIDAGALRHNGDELLRQHVLAGSTQNSERGWRLHMTPETVGLTALAVAVQGCSYLTREQRAGVL